MEPRARRWLALALVAVALGAAAGYVLAPRVFAEAHLGEVESMRVQVDGHQRTLHPGDPAFAPLAREALSTLHGIDSHPRAQFATGQPEAILDGSDHVAVLLREGHAVTLPKYETSTGFQEADVLLDAVSPDLADGILLCTSEPRSCGHFGTGHGFSTLRSLARAVVDTPPG